jgi:hypothetical protein
MPADLLRRDLSGGLITDLAEIRMGTRQSRLASAQTLYGTTGFASEQRS